MKKKLITKIMSVAVVVAMAMPQFAMSVHAEETDGVVSANEIVVENTETTLTLGQTQNGGSIDSVSDVDTYVIQIDQPGEYSIILNDNSNELYVDVFQGRNSNCMACNPNVSADMKKYFHANAAGEYIITVSADDPVDDNCLISVEQPEERIGTTYGITVDKEEGDNWIGGYNNRSADIEFNRWYKDSSESGWEDYYYNVPADGYITIEVKYDDIKQVRQHWWINHTELQHFQIYGTGESYTTEKIFVEKGNNYQIEVVSQWGQDVPYDFIVRYERKDIPINEKTFPDAVFREWVLENVDTDDNNSLSNAEIVGVTSLTLKSSMGDFKNLDGIEYFDALTSLHLDGCTGVTELDVSNNTKLNWLSCTGTKLSHLDISECSIDYLNIPFNSLAYLNLPCDFEGSNAWWYDNHEQTQTISLTGNTLDLSAYADFDPTKVTPINNMTIKGKVITITGEYGGYYYDMGYGHKLKVLVASGSYANEQKIDDFVSRMYTVALSRESEAAGQADWSNQLINQEIDGAGIANGFINSAEFKNRNLSNSDFLDTLYQTFFNRAADEGGKSNWMTFLNNGGSRNEVLAGFVNSEEFSNLCDNYGIARGTMQADGSSIYKPGVRNYVLRMYTVALSRGGETLGVEDWSNRINTGAMNPEEVAKSFFSSQEFLNRNLSNEEYVETLYETFMDRPSDAAGKADWVGRLNAGVSRREVLEGFSRSPEFGNIMKSYGL